MSSSVTFDLSVTHDAVCVGGPTMAASGMITVNTEAPDIDIVASSSTTENLAIDRRFSIDHTLQNTSSVPADTVYFCVAPNSNAVLDSIKVGTVLLSIDPDAGSTCYLIEGVLLPGGALDGSEQITVTEYWRATSCTDAGDDLSRTATYGCAGTAACLDSDPPTITDISFQAPANPYMLTITGSTSVEACNDTITYGVTLTNTSGDNIPLRDALINLNLETGVSYFNVQATGDSVVQRVGEDILLGTLADGESTSFSVDVFYDCSAASTTNLSLDVIYDDFCGGGTSTGNESYGPITVNRAEPSITAQAPNTVRIINGKRDTVVTTVENIGTAAADTVLYCIKDNMNGTVESVSVGGVTLPTAGSAPTGYTCYIITKAAFQAAIASDSLSPAASIQVSEHWVFHDVACTGDAPDGERRVLFPCTTSDQDCHDTGELDNTVTSFFYPTVGPPMPPTVTIEGPESASVCGPDANFKVTVSNENPGTNNYLVTGVGAIGYLPEGMVFNNVTVIRGPAIELVGNVIAVQGDLAPADSLVFTFDIGLVCDIDGSETFFTADFFYDPYCGTEKDTINLVSPNFIVQRADLSILSTDIEGNLNPAENQLDAILNQPDTLKVPVVNGGVGALTDFVYYTINSRTNGDLTVQIQDVLIGGNSLSQISTSGDTTFWQVEPGDITNAEFGGGADMDTLFEENESLLFHEVWLPVACELVSAAPVQRGSFYGCVPGEPLAVCNRSNEPASPVDFSNTLPDLSASRYTPLENRPTCYDAEPTDYAVQITNTGNAPARDVYVDIGQGNSPGSIVASSIEFSVNSANPIDFAPVTDIRNISAASGTVGSSGQCVLGAGYYRDADLFFENLDLNPGDVLYVRWSTETGCDCRGCNISDIYYSAVQDIDYTDYCGRSYDGPGVGFPRFDAGIDGYIDGESFVTATGENCAQFEILSMYSDWINSSNYPDAYFEVTVEIPPGLDLTDVRHVNNSGGTTAAVSNLQIVDGNSGGNDVATFRLYSIVSGYFELCYQSDCGEVANGCSQRKTLTFNAIHITDDSNPDCTSCAPNATCGDSFELITNCEPCDPNCAGLRKTDLEIYRENYGLVDANNDQTPDDGVTKADRNNAQSQLYVRGDTLRADMVAVVQDTNGLTTWSNAFLEFNTQTTQYNILGGTFTVKDASNGYAELNCAVLPQFKDGSTLVTNLSPADLNALGCTDFAGFEFAEGDSLFVTIRYSPTNSFGGQITSRLFEPAFYLSDNGYELGTVSSCNTIIETMYQVGISDVFSNSVNDFGGCTLSPFSLRRAIYFGNLGFDEFTNEIRSPGIPQEMTFIKTPEFEYVPSAFNVNLIQRVDNDRTIVNATIPGQYLVFQGDTVTFAVEDYLQSLGDNRIIETGIDNGFDVFFNPRIQGNCLSEVRSYQSCGQVTTDVVDYMFGQNLDVTNTACGNWDYTGGPQLIVSTPTPINELFGQTACVIIEMENITNISAPNSWLDLTSLTGGIVPISLTEITDPNNPVEYTPTAFGLYQLGTTAGDTERIFELCINTTNCDPQRLQFDGGWDCNGYPATAVEATCSNPSTIDFITVPGRLAGQLNRPREEVVKPLCEDLVFEYRFSSTNLGSINDIVFDFALPLGLEYIPGSFTIGYPIPFSGDTTFVHVEDPVNVFQNQYRINVTDLDATLQEEGLIGSPGSATNENIILVRWLTTTTCDYSSGDRATFRVQAEDACGNPTNTVESIGPRLFIEGAVPDYNINITLDEIALNPCNNDAATVTLDFLIDANPGVMTAMGDSIRMILPPGVDYITNSRNPVLNAVDQEPIRNVDNNGVILSWPIQPGLGNNDRIVLDLDIQAMDAAQECRKYQMIVQAYTGESAVCDGMACDVDVLSGQDAIDILFEKPSFQVLSTDLNIATNPPSSATLDYEITVRNTGLVTTGAGFPLNIELYSDENNNGLFEPGIDQLYTTISETVNLNVNQQQTVTGSISVPPTGACQVLAVVNPETTCACSVDASDQTTLEIQNNLVDNYQLCSGETVSIGPGNLMDYDYQWIAIGDANISALSATNTTPVDFSFDNNTGETLVWQYAVRTSFDGCFQYDTLEVTIYPAVMDMVSLQACSGESLVLPGPVEGSNFSWSPTTGLNDPTIASPTLDPVPAGTSVYTLTYTDGGGCTATREITITNTACAANTSLGNYVWFDENEDGIQDAGDIPIPNVNVFLYNATNTSTNNFIRRTTTDGNGEYLFDNLPAGNYVVRFGTPAGFMRTGTL